MRVPTRGRSLALVLVGVASLVASGVSAQVVSNVTGTPTEGNSIIIGGTGFGSTGPNIVLFDNFEGGMNGANIGGQAATVGTWDPQIDTSPPQYDTTFHSSGSKSMKCDFQISGNCSVRVDFPSLTSEVLLSYWLYMPTTSGFPTNSDGPNWKVSWLWHDDQQGTDLVLPFAMDTTEPFSGWYLSCNSCYQGGGTQNTYFNPDWNMYKGHWYRLMFHIRATNDSTGHEDVWTLSPATDGNLELTQNVNRTVQVYANPPVGGGYWGFLLLGAFARTTSFESRPRFDDVYVATGSSAQARVEIGDAPTYTSCKNLAIQPVTSWSATTIQATVRQGAFSSVGGQYLYVVTSGGAVSNGMKLGGSTGGAPAAPTNVRVLKSAAINLVPIVATLGFVRRRLIRRRKQSGRSAH